MKPSQAQASSSAATQNPTHLERSQLKTLEAIFGHPSAHNLEWSDAVALIEKIGEVEQKANNEFRAKGQQRVRVQGCWRTPSHAQAA